MPIPLELASAVLSFLGGGLLSIDALRARRRIRAESGARRFLTIMQAHAAGDVITDEGGHPLASETALQLWLAAHRQRARSGRGPLHPRRGPRDGPPARAAE
jgi:hypothetical protein